MGSHQAVSFSKAKAVVPPVSYLSVKLVLSACTDRFHRKRSHMIKSCCLHKKPLLPTLLLAVLCAVLVVLGRLTSLSSIIKAGGFSFAFTDAFVILAAGIGGLGCGLITFVLLFIGEIIRTSSNPSLYTVSIYLFLVMITSGLSYKGWFRSLLKALLSACILTASLAFLWNLFFTVLPLPETNPIYYGQPFSRLLLIAAPEVVLAAGIIHLFMKYAPAHIQQAFIAGMECLDQNVNILARRITFLSLFETLLLTLAAILCTNLFLAAGEKIPFSLRYLTSRWPHNLQLGLMMICTGIPIAYFFNQFILNNVVRPVNAMSRLMQDYFNTDEQNRTDVLPDLNIHTGDEVERLYHSLQKMVRDMSLYIRRILENEKRTAHLTQDFMLALAKAVDAKDHYTSGHSQRVARYSREIARRMGKSEQEQQEIYLMGLLHDIGKIGVPETIINKNGRLTDEEFKKIKEHPVVGHEILQNIEEMPALATGARWHHERYDGHGYPDSLSGENIPEEARIICVADSYDAMTSNRAYSNIRPQEQVRSEIIRCRGTQFDPKIADIMVQMIDEDTHYSMHG